MIGNTPQTSNPTLDKEDDYIQPHKNWKCKLGIHLWCPVHESGGLSICMRCNLTEDCYGIKRVARVKKNGAVL